MNKKFIVAAIATGLAIAIGCSRQNVEPADTAATAARSVKSLLVDNDCQCCDSGTRIDSINYANPVSGMNAGKYRHWDTTIVELCENGLKIQLEGPFGSFFRVNVGGQTGWNLGVVDTTTPNTWATIVAELNGLPSLKRCDSTGAISDTVYSANPPLKFVIGLNGSTAGVDFGLGYYQYNPDRTTTIIKDIIVWKDCVEPGECTNPSNATIAYRIRVEYARAVSVGPPSGPFWGEIKYSWECLGDNL